MQGEAAGTGTSLEGLRVAVVGGGIGGLSAGIALMRRGARVRVFERAPEIAEVGAGIQISPNGHAVLAALGLGDEFARVSVRGERVRLINGMNGREVFRLDLARLAPLQRYSFIHRADMISLLERAFRALGGEIETGQDVVSVIARPDALPRLCTAGGIEEEADVVIGADGLHSRLRAGLNGAEKPFFTRQVAWRALVPIESPPPAEARVFMGAGRHLVAYPLRGGRVMNVVAVEERNAWAAEGWEAPDDPGNLRRAFAGFLPEVRRLLARVEDVHLWGLFRHPVAASWHRGRVAILGDAAHPTLPFLAQGANMALEDAWVIADCLSEAPDEPESALAAYQERRRDRVVRVIEAANSNARNYHMRAGPARFVAHGALRLGSRIAPGLALRRFDWLYGHDVTARPGP